MHTHVGRLGLGFDFLTSGSVHAEVRPWTMSTDIVIGQAIFLFGQPDWQTPLNDLLHAGGNTPGVGNKEKLKTGDTPWKAVWEEEVKLRGKDLWNR